MKGGKGRLQNKKHDSLFFLMAEFIIAVGTRECFDKKRSITWTKQFSFCFMGTRAWERERDSKVDLGWRLDASSKSKGTSPMLVAKD